MVISACERRVILDFVVNVRRRDVDFGHQSRILFPPAGVNFFWILEVKEEVRSVRTHRQTGL